MTRTTDGKTCYACGKPIGPLGRAEEVKSGEHRGKWKHAPSCPEPARPTDKRAFDFLPSTPNVKSTEGATHKEHKDRNVQLPPKRLTK